MADKDVTPLASSSDATAPATPTPAPPPAPPAPPVPPVPTPASKLVEDLAAQTRDLSQKLDDSLAELKRLKAEREELTRRPRLFRPGFKVLKQSASKSPSTKKS